MTLNEAQTILDKAFKKHHRAWMAVQRATSHPSENDVIQILTNSNYVSKLKRKEAQEFASCVYWENRIKDGSYKTHKLDDYTKKYYNLQTHDTIRKELKDIHNKELEAA